MQPSKERASLRNDNELGSSPPSQHNLSKRVHSAIATRDIKPSLYVLGLETWFFSCLVVLILVSRSGD